MCRIPYEKCVCFIILVILAVLSCSGFRIDNLAMTDISKRNSNFTSSALFASSPLDSVLLSRLSSAHRHRHHRRTTGDDRPKPNKHKNRTCPTHSVSWKAYHSNTIIIAEHYANNETIDLFQLNSTLKGTSRIGDGIIKLQFHKKMASRRNCADYGEGLKGARRRPQVNFRFKTNVLYILYLNKTKEHTYKAAFPPDPYKRKLANRLKKVMNKTKPVKLRKHGNYSCSVSGMPIPIIFWKLKEELLYPKPGIMISQTRRNSTLVIKNPKDSDVGDYKCYVRGIDGQITEPSLVRGNDVRITEPSFNKTKCIQCNEETMRLEYCQNGGSCCKDEMGVKYCECPDGFTGIQCETKSSSQSSTYQINPYTTCQIGIFTSYDDCPK